MKPRRRILLVEDDQPLRTSIARGLREASYDVDQAATGPEALTRAEERSYDAIVLDILLPELSGTAVCGVLRARGDRVPILMLTALDGVEQRIAGLDAGADDYLIKPFDFGELLARLRALTRRAHEVLASELMIGDLVIDTLRRTARRGEREIALTAREFDFLLYLAHHTGRVVSRAELMERVWEGSPSTYSNIIDVYASRLRRKIDGGETVRLLTTHRGTGFRLEAPETAPSSGSASRSGRKTGRRRK